jgi:hypothetical protein
MILDKKTAMPMSFIGMAANRNSNASKALLITLRAIGVPMPWYEKCP